MDVSTREPRVVLVFIVLLSLVCTQWGDAMDLQMVGCFEQWAVRSVRSVRSHPYTPTGPR